MTTGKRFRSAGRLAFGETPSQRAQAVAGNETGGMKVADNLYRRPDSSSLFFWYRAGRNRWKRLDERLVQAAQALAGSRMPKQATSNRNNNGTNAVADGFSVTMTEGEKY
jgi:hypothetical protein